MRDCGFGDAGGRDGVEMRGGQGENGVDEVCVLREVQVGEVLGAWKGWGDGRLE